MNLLTIDDPIEFVALMNGLHDVRIDQFAWDTDAEILKLNISAHFEDAPDYHGHKPTALIFGGLTEISVDVDMEEGIRISIVDILPVSSGFRLEIDLNIGGGSASMGRRSIFAKFKTLSVESIH